jgi:hypothetical protein
MVEDEEHQVSGVVAVGYENGRLPLERFDHAESGDMFDMRAADGGFDKDMARGVLGLTLSLPIRPMGYHITADTTQWQGIFDMVAVTICKYVRLRLRFHYGAQQEVNYSLMTHGIPVDALPVTPEGDVDVTYHMQWIEYRRQLEAARYTRKDPHQS